MKRTLFVFGVAMALLISSPAGAQSLPTLTGPVNDFAHVLSRDESDVLDKRIRALLANSPKKDMVVVVTVESFAPYASIEEYAVKLFEKAGPGQSKVDNGVLIVLARTDRKVRIEVGYDLEEFITDGFSSETIRQFMLPEFRRGAYGAGLVAGTTRVIQRLADARGITLADLPPPAQERSRGLSLGTIILIILIVIIVSRIFRGFGGPPGVAGRTGRMYRGGPWSGWSGGVGGFGGGFGGFGGSGGGGGGGGFGGFGGGHSGGGGASGGW
jgi:uncharacterized protein